MKFYEVKRENGSIAYWYTQRNTQGIYFRIERLDISKKFRLLINGEREGATDHDTLAEAITAAKKINEKMEGVS